jgi:hypothetical protein
VEGLRNALNTMPECMLTKHDIVILVEKFLAEDIPIGNFYTVHSKAKQRAKSRLTGGITCLFKPHLQPAHIIYNGKNVVAISMEAGNIIGEYFKPETGLESIIDTMVAVITEVTHRKLS